MKRPTFRSVASPLALLIAIPALSACGGGGGGSAATPTPTGSTPTPTPTPPTVVGYSVSKCVTQLIPGTGLSVVNAVIPDTLKLDFARPSGFPNGRQLADPVIDITLAVIFLDLSVHPASTLAGVPVNPPANDLAFRTSFPYLAAAQGTHPVSGTAGTNFDFRTDDPSAYTIVDRMGMPAVATALISSSMKNAYNDGTPTDDISGKFANNITSTLSGLVTNLHDDFERLRLTNCGVPG